MTESDRRAALTAAVPVGQPVAGRSRTIAAAEIMLLSAVSEVAGPAYSVDGLLRAAQAELDPHLVLPVVISLSADSPLFRRLDQDLGLVIVAALSHRVSALAPVRGGDTISVTSVITELRPSASRADHYVMTVQDTAANQRGETIARADRVLLLHHKPAATTAETG